MAYGSASAEAASSTLGSLLNGVTVVRAGLGTSKSAGGPARLQAARPVPWKMLILWSVLGVGVALLGWMAYRLIAQVSGTYGRSVADTIIENRGNTLILRCSASERGGTSEFASKLIGQHQVIHTTHSRSRRSNEWLGTTTMSEHISIEPAVMASEIERLPDLAGFPKFASVPDWQFVRLTPADYPGGPHGRASDAAQSAVTPAQGG